MRRVKAKKKRVKKAETWVRDFERKIGVPPLIHRVSSVQVATKLTIKQDDERQVSSFINPKFVVR